MGDMIEVYSKNGRTVSVRSDLADAWRATNRECPDCKGHGSFSYCAGGNLWVCGWAVYETYRCGRCRGTGFVRPTDAPGTGEER